MIPDEGTVEAICSARRKLCGKIGLSGTEVLPEHLHVTLWHVIDDIVPPAPGDIDALLQRATTIEAQPFRIAFTRAKSLSRGAFVLYGGKGSADLEALSVKLRDALTRPGTEKKRPFMPHMTLLRSETILPSRGIKPITWTAREIVLMHSLLGKTTHHPVGRLPLRPGPQLSLPGFDF
ncbi:2'-5' RNA ligase family protein [Reyranella sp.]|uniref:2'-5' RNA ligase family protein n=1 Tax=Reyranella sp. TaxID=1929291 RepID=UPI0025D43B2D|nr:2'-5' RNA ligase family protein [Reyranella sp.]